MRAGRWVARGCVKSLQPHSMFWRLGFAQSSPIETLLDSNDYTLQQLMDEDDLVQECKQLNNKLLDFLSLPEQVEAMVNYIVDEPPADASDKVRLVYPYKSSEVLSSDVGSIHDCLLGHDALLDKLFNIIKVEEGELNFMMAGFFSKVLTAMMNYRPEDTLAALHARSALPFLLQHINTCSILELLQKVLQEAEEASGGPGEGGWPAWLVAQDVVPKLLDKFASSDSAQVHENVSGALVWVLSQDGQRQWMPSPRSKPAPLAKRLLEPDMVSALLDKCLVGKGTAVQNGISVVLEVTKVASKELNRDPLAVTPPPKTPDPHEPGGGDEFVAGGEGDRKSRRESAILPDTALGKVLDRLGDLVALLHAPPPMAAITNSTGTLNPPLGGVRLSILELIAILVALENPVVQERLAAMRVMTAVLDIFFKYEWHNMLHNLVRKMLEPVILSAPDTNTVLRKSLLDDGQLVSRIIQAHADNEEHVKQPKATRKGYMGQLRVLTIALIKAAAADDIVKAHTQGNDWKDFLKAHPEITDELQSQEAKSNRTSPAHTFSAAHEQDFFESCAALADMDTDEVVLDDDMNMEDDASREPAPPGSSPSAVVDSASVDAIARVVASVSLSLKMEGGKPIASALVGVKVA